MNEEKYLEERMAKQNPFKVPEGYFDSFAEHVMQQLPQRQAQAKHMWLRPWMYAAASLLVAVFSIAIYFSNTNSDASEMAAANASDSYIEEAADYAMIDNEDIYYLLAEY
jgi:hypothetical protein